MGKDPKKLVRIQYRNHRGEVNWRTIEPLELWYGDTEWHPDPQWLLKAFDHDKKEWRDFAVKDILVWAGS